jgi:hypothetical protein
VLPTSRGELVSLTRTRSLSEMTGEPKEGGPAPHPCLLAAGFSFCRTPLIPIKVTALPAVVQYQGRARRCCSLPTNINAYDGGGPVLHEYRVCRSGLQTSLRARLNVRPAVY